MADDTTIKKQKETTSTTQKIATVDKDVEKLEPLCSTGENVRWRFLKNKNRIILWPVVPLLGIYTQMNQKQNLEGILTVVTQI